MLFSAAVIVIALIALIVYLRIFRLEGMLALYICGFAAMGLVVQFAGLGWDTMKSGMFYGVTFVVTAGWMILAHSRDAVVLPRRFTLAVALIGFLGILMELRLYMYAGQASGMEQTKWIYVIFTWIIPFWMGVAWPLSLPRLRRFISAMVWMGIAIALTTLVSWATGHVGTVHEAATRYSASDRLHGLSFAITLGLCASAMLAYIFIANQTRKNIFRDIVCWGGLAVMVIAIALTGTRAPLLFLAMVTVVFLLLMGGRTSIRIGIGLSVAIVLLLATHTMLPETALKRLSSTETGTSSRIVLIERGLQFAAKNPVWGTPVGFGSATAKQRGGATSHNLTVQILMELGIVGLFCFLVAAIPTILRWSIAAFRRTPTRLFAAPLLIVFLQVFLMRHSSGNNVLTEEIWLLFGIMMGHSLTLVRQPVAGGLDTGMPPGAWSAPMDLRRVQPAT
ncbi:MAG: O-antigen ligase family protein [Phycisphaerae bacterium]|nr:O-antigen ligase family protein [Phycisphaerae bacterium]